MLKGGLGGGADDLADLKGARLGHSAFVPGKPRRGKQDVMHVLGPTRCQPGQHGAAQEASRIFIIQKTFQVSPTAFQAQGLRRDNFSPWTKARITWEAKHNQNQQGGGGLFLFRAAEVCVW